MKAHQTLTLKQIDPKSKPSFSPNLHKYMNKHGHFFEDGGARQGVFTTNTEMWIGYIDDGLFMGTRLMSALTQGAKAQPMAYTKLVNELTPDESFWERYLAVGRCAIDPQHQMHFIDVRFAVDGDSRTCTWCGHTQKKVRTPRTVYDESWETV